MESKLKGKNSVYEFNRRNKNSGWVIMAGQLGWAGAFIPVHICVFTVCLVLQVILGPNFVVEIRSGLISKNHLLRLF